MSNVGISKWVGLDKSVRQPDKKNMSQIRKFSLHTQDNPTRQVR